MSQRHRPVHRLRGRGRARSRWLERAFGFREDSGATHEENGTITHAELEPALDGSRSTWRSPGHAPRDAPQTSRRRARGPAAYDNATRSDRGRSRRGRSSGSYARAAERAVRRGRRSSASPAMPDTASAAVRGREIRMGTAEMFGQRPMSSEHSALGRPRRRRGGPLGLVSATIRGRRSGCARARRDHGSASSMRASSCSAARPRASAAPRRLRAESKTRSMPGSRRTTGRARNGYARDCRSARWVARRAERRSMSDVGAYPERAR